MAAVKMIKYLSWYFGHDKLRSVHVCLHACVSVCLVTFISHLTLVSQVTGVV